MGMLCRESVALIYREKVPTEREREREREREAAIDVLVHVPAFLVDFRSNPRSTDNPGQSCSSSRGR